MRALLSIALVSWGCGNVSDDRPPGETPAFTLSVLTPSSALPLDGMGRVGVEIERTGGFTGAVAIAGASLPSGVVVAPATIAEDATTAELLVGAAAPLAIGQTITYELEATGDGVDPQTATLADALVTGRPGTLDTSFGPGTGLATISFGSDDSGAFTALDVINGSVLATGFGVGGLGAIRMTTIRFTAAGVVDPAWSGGALVRTNFGTSSGDDARALAIGQQTDGRSVAIGFHRGSGLGEDIALVRYSLTGGAGGVDFGSMTGKGLVDLGGAEVVHDGLVRPSSSILAVGTLDGHFLVAQMSPSGFLDTGFAAPSGHDRVILGSASQADAVTADGQDRLVVAGTFTVGGQTDLVLRRYSPDGRLDATFGMNGQVIVPGAANERTAGVRMLGDKVVLASTAVDAGTTSFRVRRFLAGGELDAGFGVQGLAEARVDTGHEALRMVVLSDGRTVVLGAAGNEALLVRFTSRGEADPLFGPAADGKVKLFIGDSGAPASIEVYSNHQIVIGGGNQGGVPGPGTFGVVARMWM